MYKTNFEIKSDNLEVIKSSLAIAFNDCKTISGYKVDDEYGLILYKTPEKHDKDIYPNEVPLLYKHDLEDAYRLVSGWLKEVPAAFYGPTCGGDGTDVKGFKIYNSANSRFFNEYRAFVAIKPIWIYYGK